MTGSKGTEHDNVYEAVRRPLRGKHHRRQLDSYTSCGQVIEPFWDVSRFAEEWAPEEGCLRCFPPDVAAS